MTTPWPGDDAFAYPDIWLGATAHSHCVQWMALLPQFPGATRLLLRLKGQHIARERQLVALFGTDPVADKVRDAVLLARGVLATKNDAQPSNTVVAS